MILSLEEIKSLLQISLSDTSKDDLIGSLNPVVQDFVLKFTENSFEILTDTVYKMSNTISFETTPLAIKDSDAKLLEIGFIPGLHVKVTGSKLNDGTYKVKSVTAESIELEDGEKLYAEANDSRLTILITVVRFPEGIKLPVSKIIGYHLNKSATKNVQSESLGDHSISYTAGGSYPESILTDLKQYRLLKSSGPVKRGIYDIFTKTQL